MTAPQQLSFALPADNVAIKDFTIKEKRVRFKIDDDIFEASAIMSIPMMQSLVSLSSGLGDIAETDDYSGLNKIFTELLMPDSAKRFNERLGSRGDDGIDLKRQLLPIVHYLMETYGVRPTQPSLDSSAG